MTKILSTEQLSKQKKNELQELIKFLQNEKRELAASLKSQLGESVSRHVDQRVSQKLDEVSAAISARYEDQITELIRG